MTDLSLTTFLRYECHRFLDRLTGSPPSLDTTEEAVTIRDHVERYDLADRLPDGWSLALDIVQFADEPPAEVVHFTGSGDGYRITLKPLDLRLPTEEVELYTRPTPFEGRNRRETTESLSEAVETATRIATKCEQRRQRIPGRSVGPTDRPR